MRRERKEAWGLALEGHVEREAGTLVLAVGTLSNLGHRSLTWLLQEDNFGGGGSEYMQINTTILLAVLPRWGWRAHFTELPEIPPGHQFPQPGPREGVWAPLNPCGRREPLVASGPGVAAGRFHKPGQGQAWATGLPRGLRQEELAADVSPCANLWLPASGAFQPPACQPRRKPGAWRGPEALMPRLGLHGWTNRLPWPWVPRTQRWSPVRGLHGAGLESGGPDAGWWG